MTKKYIFACLGSSALVFVHSTKAQIGTRLDAGFEQKLIDSQTTTQQDAIRDTAASRLTKTPTIDAVGLAGTKPNDVIGALGELAADRAANTVNDKMFGSPAENIYDQHNQLSVEIPKAVMKHNDDLASSDLATQAEEMDKWMTNGRRKLDAERIAKEEDSFKVSSQNNCRSGALSCQETREGIVCSPSVPDSSMPSGRRSLRIITVQCVKVRDRLVPVIKSRVALDNYFGPGRLQDYNLGSRTISTFNGSAFKSYCERCDGRELIDCQAYPWTPYCLFK